MAKATSADVSRWLREETPEHLALMSKLRQRLATTIESDVTEAGTPSRDWCRALNRYQSSFQLLVSEERERFKIRLLMSKAGDQILSDEDYEKELRELAVESLGTLPVDALHRELEKRGADAPRLVEKDDDDD